MTLHLTDLHRLRDGKQHVDITWQLGEHGERLAGSGRARSKKQARREAAKKLLKLLPVGKEAEIQMRKQMLRGLRYKLSAEAVNIGNHRVGGETDVGKEKFGNWIIVMASSTFVRHNQTYIVSSSSTEMIPEVVEDGVAGAVNNDRGLQQIYRVLWKVPRPQGRAPAEVSAEGRGGTVAEAQVWERRDNSVHLQ